MSARAAISAFLPAPSMNDGVFLFDAHGFGAAEHVEAKTRFQRVAPK
jgi:hypothetical protein